MKNKINKIESECGRLVWHPLVHKRFSEELHYFLIKTNIYSSTFKKQLHEFLFEIGTEGFCMYEIFGNYDILLRVWFTNENRLKFVEYIENRPEIAGIEEFFVQGFNISWHDESGKCQGDPNVDDLIRLSPETIQKAQFGQLSEPEMKELSSKHILLSREISFSNKKFKFFVLMDYASSPLRDFKIREYIEQFIDNQRSYVDKVSVYSGIGFTRYIIKAVSKNFYDILRFILALISEFRILNVQTNTVVVAEENPYESDNITFGGNLEEETVRFLVPELYEQKEISMEERYRLAIKIYQSADAFIHDDIHDDKGILQQTMQFIISKDSKGLAACLGAYFAEFEQFLRESFPQFTTKLCRSESPDKIDSSNKIMQDAYKYCKILENKKAFLGEWIDLYKYVITTILSAENNWVKENIEVFEILKTAATWRNKFAHADYGDIIQDWEELIDFLAKFVPVKRYFEAYIEEKKKG
jgi:hypothetical protein